MSASVETQPLTADAAGAEETPEPKTRRQQHCSCCQRAGTRPEADGSQRLGHCAAGAQLHAAAGGGKERRLRIRRLRRTRKSSTQPQQKAAQMSSRSLKFQRLFDIPESEVLIKTFPCALKAEILLQGTFYVSANYFCFYARIASKRKTIKIPVRTVCELTREKTAIFFPNAIGIRTDSDRFEFGSIISRDSTFKLLRQLWHAALLPVPQPGGTQPEAAGSLHAVLRLRKSASDSDLCSRTQAVSDTAINDMKLKAGNCVQQQRQQQQQQQQRHSRATQADELRHEAPAACSQRLQQLQEFFRGRLSFLLSDRRLTFGSSAIVACLLYVLYLAYSIHVIQQSISWRLEELLHREGRSR